MQTDLQIISLPSLRRPQTDARPTRKIYFDLLQRAVSESALSSSRHFLEEQLNAADSLACDLPEDVAGLSAWIDSGASEIGCQYQEYLEQRQAGGPRRYFPTKSHALHFLKAVAPTKTVDGSWLYGLVRHWNDARFTSLIRIYLEELGEGLPDKNHVALYKKLLATHGCDKWQNLSDEHFVQGAIQLSLAQHAQHFLPEVIGFNFGYEQLPLHLLITAYELNELGIDPYYFTLHVTVDNADTGHAQKSLQGLVEALPLVGDPDAFWRRVRNGYRLNMLGASTCSVIESFDLEKELVEILADKSTTGRQVHSDYCRVGGRTVNDWLARPQQIPGFLNALEQAGWIKRHQDPQNSRFWKLIQSDRAEMFGVFNVYEQQVIYDWIAGDRVDPQRHLSYKARQKLLDQLGQRGQKNSDGARPSARIDEGNNDFDRELRHLDECLAAATSRDEAMTLLAELMAPHSHHTAAGLKATRLYSRMLG